tara:strand:+ start:15 stop:296 length:282 start_codon:yes stop_codon:yes gene_type:complete
MKIMEIMERAGVQETGRAISYVKEALNEINQISETNITTAKLDIDENKRFYDIPKEAVKITDIRCKNHLNNKSEYRSIPRMIYDPVIKDEDGV